MAIDVREQCTDNEEIKKKNENSMNTRVYMYVPVHL